MPQLDMSKIKFANQNPTFKGADNSPDHAAGNRALGAMALSSKLNMNMLKMAPKPAAPEKTPADANPNGAPFPLEPGDTGAQAGLKAIGNVPKSTMNLVSGIINAITHPLATVKGIGKALLGEGKEVYTALTGKKAKDTIGSEAAFDAIKQVFIKRYGSLDAAAKTATEDPMGFGADVLSLIDAGAGAVGKGAEASEIASRVASPVADPLESAAGKVTGKITAPFKSSYEEGTAKAFDEAGIKAPVSAVTKSKFLQGAEGLLGKSPFGTKIRNIVTSAMTELDTRTNKLVESLSPAKTMSDSALGETIQNGVKDFEDNFKQTQNKIYDEFSKTYGASNTVAMNTKQTLDTIIKEQGKDYFSGINPKFTKMIAKITDDGAAKNLTFDELKQTRTSVGQELDKPSNANDGALKRLYTALTKDMETAVSTQAETPFGNEAKTAKAALDKVNEGYANGKQKIQSNIAQSIKQSKPENIAQNLVKNNDPKFFAQVKEMIGQEKFKEVSDYFTRDLFDSSVKYGKFNIEKFKSVLSGYDKDTLSEVIPKEQLDKINDAVTSIEKNQVLTDAIKKGTKMTEGSQTAALQQVARVGGEVGGIVTSIAMGNFGAAVGIASGLIGESLATKLFTSDIGRKLLTEGLTAPNLKALKSMNIDAGDINNINSMLKYVPSPSTQSSE